MGVVLWVCLKHERVWFLHFAGSQFKDEDDLTRKFKLEKEYQVFVKMDKRVPGTK